MKNPPPAGARPQSAAPTHRRVLARPDVWGSAAVLVAALAVFLAVAAPGLVQRAHIAVPLDSSASSKAFLEWAFGQLGRSAGTQQLAGLQLDAGELNLTMRTGSVEQHWRVFPQDLPELVGSGPLTPTEGVVAATAEQAGDLAMVWSDYKATASDCPDADLSVVGAATWGGAMHFTASCHSGATPPREWIGTRPVELQGTLSTRYSLAVMMTDLSRISPPAVGSLELTMPGVDAVGCRIATSWRQQMAGAAHWITQSRLCYTEQPSGYLPVGVVAAPGDARAQLAHPLLLSRIDAAVLEGLSSDSGLPAYQTDITTVHISWSERFGQQVIAARSGAGSSARVGWYTLAGQLLALDRG
ncbi:hypothetical protein SAMN05443377_10812 [Propionibacterium cyclohexanicum]|uniref:Uncharacterized protein n=1 Tax=Propionibacterium cyclohexanicum TaxID=64702 RepID=A0A1H9RLI1_9ACTN|nr:hypothetical protein [Propionibacterium cyclohexanicum]SER73610.1 hypothetical protein SAMN05443377_10812 [Propionibacterium cyclohexanicum]